MPEVKDTANRFVSAFNAHNESALLALHAESIKFNAPGGFKAANAKDATSFPMRWLKAFPDSKMTVRTELVSGPWVIQEVTVEGTHNGPLETPSGTISPTYKKIRNDAVHCFRIENEKIAEARVYFDNLDLMTQLGLIPMPATA